MELGDGIWESIGFDEAVHLVVFAEFGKGVGGHRVTFSLEAGVDDEAIGWMAEEVISRQAPVPEVGGDIGAEDGVELIFA